MKPIKSNLHKVAIVGRPNVGKSTLFNRILKKRKSIVEEFGPTTRDRISAIVNWSGKDFELIDTPGLDIEFKENLSALIEKQIMTAIKEADQIVFVCDGIDGILQMDHKICSMLRKTDKKIILAVNKVDNRGLAQKAQDFHSMGFGEPELISSLHGLGIADLLDKVVSNIGETAGRNTEDRHAVKLAVIGKPNAGKSSFVNAILGEERITVSEIPGTTRDSIDIYFEKDRQAFIIIDTAGIRSKAKIKDAVTYFSILRTEESVKKSDVSLLIIDAPLGITKEDHKIIDLVQKSLRPFILVINKWDLAEKNDFKKNAYEKVIRESIRFIYNAPIVFISALRKHNLDEPLNLAYELSEKSKKNFSTSHLNEILRAIKFDSTRVYSIVQVRNSPIEFEIVVKNPEAIGNNDKGFFVNIFRKKLNLEGVPLIIRFKKKVFK
ncbi:MAG: ribosome biogenesis GTPase Der [Candidatus Omnitrophota bacterium]|nr:ribosome biogenesis GTPase Der [Candidatus Omnitrophota bacterium]